MKGKKVFTREDIDYEIESKRDSFSKVYQLKNGHKIMTISSEPQHYKGKDGKYVEFSNELIEGEEGLCATRGHCRMILPDGTRNTDKVKIASDKCGIEWELVKPIDKKCAKMTAPEIKLENQTDEKAADALTFAPVAHHTAKYKDVLEGVDIEYEVLNNGIKENIIINEAVENPTFTFSMKASGLVPLEDKANKMIEFYEKIDGDELGDKKFVIPAPFMIDAAGVVSDSVSYTLKEKTTGEYEFTVLVDKEWVNDNERVYPVTVDPYIHYYDRDTIYVTPNDSIVTAEFRHGESFGTDLKVNISNVDGNTVSSAKLYLIPIKVEANADYKLYCESYSDSASIDKSTCSADITSMLISAAKSGKKSFLLTLGAKLICPCNPIPDTYYAKITFLSNIFVIVEYHESEYYENNQSFVGDALAGSVNLSNGKLIFSQEDCHTGSAAIPFALSHYYNIDKRDSIGAYGNGWDLSINQRVEWIGGHTIIAKYTDGLGMVHYFADNYTDLGGLEMGLNRENGCCAIRTKDGTRLSFNSDGLLTQVKDINDNTITITRNSSGNISNIKDSFGREMTLTYSSGKLIRITDPSNRATTFTYDSNGLLTGVSYPDGSTVEYTYANNMLKTVKNRDNTITSYTYSALKVTKVEKYPAGSNVSSSDPEEYLNIEYKSAGSTAVSDRSGIRKVYVFDDCGRAQVIYEDTPIVVNGEQISNRFQVTGTTIYNYTGTKRTFASTIRTCDESNNFVINGSFENFDCSSVNRDEYWTFNGSHTLPCGSTESDGVVQEDSIDHSKSYRLVGNTSSEKQLKQRIPAHRVTLDYGDSLILTAWAKATAYIFPPDGTRENFYISAIAHYTDGTVGEENIAYFITTCGDWQYGATSVRIDRTKELSHIDITLDFSYRSGTCLFDHVRLVNAPATSAVYEYEGLTPSSAVIFGKKKGFTERITAHDGIYTVVEEKAGRHVLRRTVTDQDGHSFVSVFEYDNKRRLIRTQNERGIITEYTYNSLGMQTSVKSYYWPEFNPDFATGVINPTEYFKSETEYDSTGEFSVGVSDQRDENIKTQNSYNTTNGLLNSTTTPNGQVTNYTYDSNSDLVTSVSTMIGSTEYSVLYGYTNNKLTSITHNGFNYNFTYDGMGRVKKVKIADTDYTENSYVLTNTTTVSTTYAGGEVMTVKTDRKDQPVKRTYTDKLGVTTVIAEGKYDTLGKPVKVIDNITNKEYTYVYDGYENVTEEKVNGVTFKECTYDTHNRLESTKFHVLGGTQTYRPIYDKRASDNAIYSDNAVVGITLDGVFTEKAEHDGYGRVTEKKLTLGSAVSPLFKDSYTYLDTQLGFEKRLTTMVAEIERRVGGTVKDVLKYTYDNNGNITEIKNGDELLAKYTYDGLNQLIREDNAVFSKTYTFAYDAGGNILEKKTYFYSTGELGTLIDTKTYTYAATGWKDRLTSYNGEAITYDALGNPTTYRGHSLTWAMISNLASYDTLTFDYDASGIRTRKGDITYTLDGNRILAETRPTGTIKYFYGTSGVVGFEYNNAKYFYQKNAQGDITAIYDSMGNLKAEYEYDAWGNHVVIVDVDGIGTLNPFRYRGYYYDDETGLYYTKSRYYDPEIGRFISPDNTEILTASPLEQTDKNLYAYCDNNPVSRKDDKGGFWNFIVGAFVGAASVYVSDVIKNVLDGKQGWDILKPTSSPGTYLGAAVSGMIPGSGLFSMVSRSVVSVAVQYGVDAKLTGESVDILNVGFDLVLNLVGEASAFGLTKFLDLLVPKNYSSFKHSISKYFPNISKQQTKELMKIITATIRGIEDIGAFSIDVFCSMVGKMIEAN